MSENKDLPTFLADRLPNSQTLVAILEQAGFTVTISSSDWYCPKPPAEIAHRLFDTSELNLPVTPHPNIRYMVDNKAKRMEELGLLRIIRPDKNGWYNTNEALPPLENKDEYGRLSSNICWTVNLNGVYDVGWLIEGREGKRWRGSNDNYPLDKILYWQFPKPPVDEVTDGN
jgi:hypothetical protein